MDREKYLAVAKKGLGMAFPNKPGEELAGDDVAIPTPIRFATIQIAIATLLKADGFDAVKILKEVNDSIGSNAYTDQVLRTFETTDFLSIVNEDTKPTSSI